nr:MAG: M protein [Wufeng rodent arterivirus 1]
MGLTDFCLTDSKADAAFAYLVTYGPLIILPVRYAPSQISTAIHTLIWLCMAYLLGYDLAHSASVLALRRSSLYVLYIVLIIYLVVALFYLGRRVYHQCRLCRYGRSYILANPNHVETSEGRFKIPASGTALVARTPSHTSVNGVLVPGVKNIYSLGKRLTRQHDAILKAI